MEKEGGGWGGMLGGGRVIRALLSLEVAVPLLNLNSTSLITFKPKTMHSFKSGASTWGIIRDASEFSNYAMLYFLEKRNVI